MIHYLFIYLFNFVHLSFIIYQVLAEHEGEVQEEDLDQHQELQSEQRALESFHIRGGEGETEENGDQSIKF